VQYGRLLDIGRAVVERKVPRSLMQQLKRGALKAVLPRKWLFTPLFKAGQAVRGALPESLRHKLPAKRPAGTWPTRQHARKMLVLDGCVQPAMAPNINAATARVLDTLGVQLLVAPKAGCCGALRFHLNAQEEGLDDMRRNIDAWWPYVEEGGEAIVMTASGCGVTVKEYGHLLSHDKAYAAKAERISALCRDLCEVLEPLAPELKGVIKPKPHKVAYHPPCTLQHGQQLRGKVETVLRAAGIEVSHCADSHLCCGSAGTYSVLQPELSTKLRNNKLAHLRATGAETIVSANIGCLTHLQSGTETPVRHWIELIDDALASNS
jgi:glycolate oxidase iron-sulfur subunit